MIREQREELYRLRKDLEAALREADELRHDLEVSRAVNRLTKEYEEDRNTALKEVKHQAELAVRLTIWMCRNDYANEAAEIVGKEAVEAIVKTLPADDMEKCYD